MNRGAQICAALLAAALAGCHATATVGDEIVVCGQRFHTGTPVVLWTDPGGYDAYSTVPRFRPLRADETESRRYGTRRNLPAPIAARVAERGWTLEDLRAVVHLFVLHYDVAGVSRQCFKVLQDERNLSVHFMLDVDGTLYQTLDLQERAWHATIANDHSIGIEIAHPGAYPQPGHPAMRRWYDEDAAGRFIRYPAFLGDPGVRTPEFVPRPATDTLHRGTINGREVYQFDFTPQQYEALARLTATLARVLPKVELQIPRGADGNVTAERMEPDALHAFSGIVGHYHVQTNKQDPGPAFDWERLLREARARYDEQTL